MFEAEQEVREEQEKQAALVTEANKNSIATVEKVVQVVLAAKAVQEESVVTVYKRQML